jgi:hypothetical protein
VAKDKTRLVCVDGDVAGFCLVTVDNCWGLACEASLARCTLTELGTNGTNELEFSHFHSFEMFCFGVCLSFWLQVFAMLLNRVATSRELKKPPNEWMAVKATSSITALDFRRKTAALAVVASTLSVGGGSGKHPRAGGGHPPRRRHRQLRAGGGQHRVK